MMRKERLVFMGTPDFAVAVLEKLVNAGMNIVGVITAPDRPAGRGMKPLSSAVKKYATDKGLKLLQPVKLRSPEFLEELKSLKASLQVVVAFRMLPRIVWNMPPKGTVNLHASLLPQYRGAAPINWAIINGETKTGVTTFFIQQEIDTGDIIYQQDADIGENETAGELHDRLKTIGADLILKTVETIYAGTNPSMPQKALKDSPKQAPKIFRSSCRIDWNRSAKEVHDLVRGLAPYPGAFTEISNENRSLKLKIHGAIPDPTMTCQASPGSMLASDKKLFIRCHDGWLNVTDVQLAGKKRMSASDFILGFDVCGFQAG